MSQLFVRSPLALGSLPYCEIEYLCVTYNDPDVQRAAGELRASRARVADLASYRSGIAEAIQISDRTGTAVAEVLRQLIDDADTELEAARADHLAHDAVNKSRRDLLAPLVLAVGRLSAAAATTRESLQGHIDAALVFRNYGAPTSSSRYTALQAAGLTDEQINSLGFAQPEVNLQVLRDKVAVADRVISQCAAFAADPFMGAEHLAGLGLEDLIEARRMATEQLPA